MNRKEKINLLAKTPILIVLQYIKSVVLVMFVFKLLEIALVLYYRDMQFLPYTLVTISCYGLYCSASWIYLAFRAEKHIETLTRLQASKAKLSAIRQEVKKEIKK